MLAEKILKKGGYGTAEEDREKINLSAGVVGLLSNLLLAGLKILGGILSGSVSIIADGANNLMDSTGSVITIAGVKMAGMPGDEEHPYGHGRMEYITALALAVLVIVVGVQFVRTGLDRFLHPSDVEFRWGTVGVLLFSIVVKLGQSRFNKKVGKAIDSAPLKAAAADSMGDVLVTSTVLLSVVLGLFTSLPIDGLVAILVSLFIIYSGYELIRETVSSLLGEVPSPDFFRRLHEKVCEYPEVLNVHDIIVSSFGPEKTIVVLDAEFPYYLDLVTVHDIVDRAERELSREFDIQLIIHVDPVGNPTTEERKAEVVLDRFIKGEKGALSYHDLSIHSGESLYVDITADGNIYKTNGEREALRKRGKETLERTFPHLEITVHLDLRY